jgi:hypothetical protein
MDAFNCGAPLVVFVLFCFDDIWMQEVFEPLTALPLRVRVRAMQPRSSKQPYIYRTDIGLAGGGTRNGAFILDECINAPAGRNDRLLPTGK